MGMKQMMMAAIMAGVVSHVNAAEDIGSIGSIALVDAKIKAETTKREKLVKNNPCVIFAEEDSPDMNVKRATIKDPYHPSATKQVINRKFYCPKHKQSEKCHTPRGGAWKWCQPGERAFAQWDALRRKAEQSEANVEKIKAIDETLEALKARREELKVMEQEEKK